MKLIPKNNLEEFYLNIDRRKPRKEIIKNY